MAITPCRFFASTIILLIAARCLATKSDNKRILNNWRNAFIQCVREESLSPNLMIRNLTLFSISVHDTLNIATPKYKTYIKHDLSVPDSFCSTSAIQGCGWKLATSLHPARLKHFEKLSIKLRLPGANQTSKSSFLLGGQVSQNILSNRMNDGSTTSVSYLTRTNPGLWRRTPSFYRPPEQPHWRYVKLWGLPSIDDFLPPTPPAPDSIIFRDALREVKEIGGKNSQIRSDEQTITARFWKDFSYTQTPAGHWNEIASFVAEKQNFTLIEEAKLFALLNLSMADAGIVAWECKYKHHLWRPIHAIRHADKFELTSKLHNPKWEPLIETPAHPEYISAHSCFSGAAAQILRFFIGGDKFKFRTKSDEFSSYTRTFESFSTCTEEISESRLFGGIHYRFSGENGVKTGKKIAEFCYNNLFKPLTKTPSHQ